MDTRIRGESARVAFFRQEKNMEGLPFHVNNNGVLPPVILLASKPKAERTPDEEQKLRELKDLEGLIETRKTIPLNTTIDWVADDEFYVCKREIFQNLIDECASANGETRDNPSYGGLKWIEKGKSIWFYNNKSRLAEIRLVEREPNKKRVYFDERKLSESPQTYGTLEFINYGAEVVNGRKIVLYGKSSKGNKKNQTGHYGEGLKRAIAIALSCGMGVDIYGIIKEDGIGEYTSQHWRFYTDDQGEILYKVTGVNPHATRPNSDPIEAKNAFRVKLTFPSNDPPKFKLEDYIIPLEYVVDETPANQAGSILFTKDQRGYVYVHHFFVIKYVQSYLLYGYDFFIQVTRDRNNVPHKEMLENVRKCWAHAIRTDPDQAMVYLELHMNEDLKDSKHVELQIISGFPADVKRILLQLYEEKFPDTAVKTWYQVVPDNYRGATIACQPKLVEILKPHKFEAVENHVKTDSFVNNIVPFALIDEEIAPLFRGIVDIRAVSDPHAPFTFILDESERCLYINVGYADIKDGEITRMRLLSAILSRWLTPLKIGDFTPVFEALLVPPPPPPPPPQSDMVVVVGNVHPPLKNKKKRPLPPPSSSSDGGKKVKKNKSMFILPNAPQGQVWKVTLAPKEGE